MKLYNRSPIDDKVLKAVLAKAARSVGARHGKVLVEIGHGDKLHGIANDYIRVTIKKRRIKCDCWLKVILPTRNLRFKKIAGSPDNPGWWDYVDALACAESVYNLARHEFAHVHDYQQGTMFWGKRDKAGRRARWAERPEEQRAMAACEDADALGRGHEWAADEILDLAIALEELGARESKT